MKCPIKFLEMIDWSSVCGEDHGKVRDCVEEECAWWVKSPTAGCAKKIQVMQIGAMVQQLRQMNVHLDQIEKGVYR